MVNPFVLDTNFFIEAHRQYYPMDIVPGFWLKVRELANNGTIVSIDKVRDELTLNKDLLSQWCEDNLPQRFFKDTSVVISEYVAVSQWATSRSSHYTTAALNEFLGAGEADAWLIAYAIAGRASIVTHETSEPYRKSKVKIPDACSPFGIKCLNTIEMFRCLGEKF